MKASARFALAALLLTAVAIAQEKAPAQKAPEDQVGGLRFIDVTQVTVVNVDISVLDKKGPVYGLKPEDFEVYQDGQLQELTNFAFYQAKAAAEPTPAPVTEAAAPATPTPTPEVPEANPEREPRFVAIYVDNENLLPIDRNRVIHKLMDFARDHLRPPDQMMVVSYQKSLKIPQSFTSDPDQIIEALRSLRMYTGGQSDVNSARKSVEDAIRDKNTDQNDRYVQAMGQARAFAREQRNNLVFTTRAIQELIGTMSGLPGKKSIIYLSDGLPMTPGLELFYDIQEEFQDTHAVSEAQTYQSTQLFQSLATSAAASGVTLYTVDAKGLDVAMGTSAENAQPRSPLSSSVLRSNYQDSLMFMAEETGGLAIVNTNDIGPGLEKIAEDLETYYSLGYRLVPSGEDRLHRIKVVVKGHPEYTLKYRPIFIEKTLPTKITDRVMSGLAYDLDDNPLNITLDSADPTPSTNQRWLLPVEVHIPINDVALIPDGDDLVGYVMVYYAARDKDGKQSDLQHSEHTIKVPQKDYAVAKQQFYTVTAKLLLEPGTYRISVGVRDELTNQAGYVAIRRAVHPEDAEE